ncbi:MAG: sulfatase family protein [Anaerolineae bacterium]
MTHLVMIDCHDLGQHLGCYGWSSVASDHLDQLAASGIRFENSFCTAPQCSPSRATLYTGRYAHSNGMFGLAHHPFSWRMHDDEVYLARYLQDADYETAHIGIQHVTDWDEESVQALGFEQVLSAHLAPEVAERVLQFLEQTHDRPFFLNIGFFEPHRDDAGGFKVAPPDVSRGVDLPPYIPDTIESRQEFGELQGMIKQMDEAVGAIIDALKRLDLLDDTWIIFTTDHGLAMPRAKCTMYDPGVETALIMHAPSLNLVGGKTFANFVSHVDLVPTILDGLGLPIPETLQGKSYWPLLQGDKKITRDVIYAGKTFHTDYEPQRMIRTERYKLIWNAEVDIINVPADIMHSPIYPQMIDSLTVERPPFELYDLMIDPNEQNNLAGHTHYADIQAALRQRLVQWMQDTDDPILTGPIASPYYARAIRELKG